MIRRLLAAVPLALLFSLLVLPTASAHVRVSGTDVTQGGYGVLTFRVPTESDTASTVGLTVTLPRDTPLTSVSVLPVTGWTASQRTKKLTKPINTADGKVTSYVASITWKADAPKYGLKPGEFGMFTITAGPLPDTARIVLPATQRYSDGSTVSWDEIAEDKGAEPEHPAPTLDLTPSASPASSASAASTSGATSAPAGSTPDASGQADWLSPASAGLAAVAVVIAIIALVRTVRPVGRSSGNQSDDHPTAS